MPSGFFPPRWPPLYCALALACLAALPQSAFAGEQPSGSAKATAYDIAPGRLDAGLRALVERSSVQLLYAPSLVRGKQGPGLKGRYAPDEALSRLLAGQGLTAVLVSPNTYLLQPAPIQPQPPRADRAAPRFQSETPEGAPAVAELASVTVTGSRIPRTSFQSSPPVAVISAEDIAASGAGTLYELLREQPGMTGHHPMTVASEGGKSPQPIATTASTSLYSLGPRSTLFLVDGRRVASSGLVSSDLGALFDLDSLPLSFIDHIEILRGDASAVYGADAMAGTVNLILKKDGLGTEVSFGHGVAERGDAEAWRAWISHGASTRGGGSVFLSADSFARQALPGDARAWHSADLRRFGLADGREPIGFISDQPLPPFPLQACRDAGGDPDSRFCRFDRARYRTLQPRLQTQAAYARWEQPLGEAAVLELAVRGARSERRVQAPPLAALVPILNPAHPDIPDDLPGPYRFYLPLLTYVYYDIGGIGNLAIDDTFDASLGLRGSAGGWNWRLDLSRSRSRGRGRLDNLLLVAGERRALLGDYRLFGANDAALLDAMRGSIAPSGRDSLGALEASLEGALFQAPGGPARFMAGLALRSQHTIERPDPAQVRRELVLSASDLAERDMRSHSAAAFAELSLPLHRSVQIDLAARRDRDNRFAARTSPRIGLAWTPNEHFALRASFGEGYRAPTLQDRRLPLRLGSGNAVGHEVLVPNPWLTPCRKERGGRLCIVEVGTVDNPRLRPEYSRSASIGFAFAPTDAFDLRVDHYRIERWNEFGISDGFGRPDLFPHALVRDADGVLYRIDTYLANTGRSESRGWEAAAHYRPRGQALGRWDVRLGAHYQQRHLRAPITAPEPIEEAGHAVPKLTLNGSAKWQYRDWAATLSMRHFGRSRAYPAGGECPPLQGSTGRCANPSATLWNLRLDYDGLEPWALALNINNLTDRQPANYRAGWDGYNIAMDDPYGRYYALSATYRF